MKLTRGKLLLIRGLSIQEKGLLAICRQLAKYRSRIESSLSPEKGKDNSDFSATSIDEVFTRYSGKGSSYSNEGKKSSPNVAPLFLEASSDEPVAYSEWDQVLSYVAKRQGSWQTSHLEELIRDRISSLSPFWKNGSSKGKPQWVCDAVDFYDELLSLAQNADSKDMTALSLLQETLLQAFKAMGIELFRESSWNPEIQRAISVEKTLPPHASPIIKEQGASGIRLDGRLLRKQEVILQTSL